MQEAILGLDVGTSAMKAVLYTPDGTELFAAERDYRLVISQPGWVELDAAELWRTLVALLRMVTDATASRARIVSLAMAAQAGSTLPVDGGGVPLAPMMTWMDQRAAPVVAAWENDGTAARIRALSGWRPQAGLTIAAIAWLVQHRPEVVRRTRYFLGAHDYLVHCLTGRPVTDLSEGAEMLLLDHATGDWSDELCAISGIRHTQLADLMPAGAVAGTLLPAVAAATGLPADTAVVVGGQDQCCAALGMGATSPGQVMLASGTAWVITALIGKMRVDQAPAQVDLNYHVVPEVHTVSQLLGPFGATVEWWLNEACPSGQSAQATTRTARYAVLDHILAGSVPGARDLLFLPLGGSSQLAGCTARGGFVGLRLDHTHVDMARALLEGAAFEVRWALVTMAHRGLSADGMWMSGGATRSSLWPEIVASVTGLPLCLARGANWPARGAGLLAAAGAGLASDLVEAAVRWAQPMTTVTPDASLCELYAARYAAYREVTWALASGRP